MTEHIQVFRSFIAAEALAELISANYDFDAPIKCKLFSKLIRTQDNDHYLVTVGDQKYVARVYQLGTRLKRQIEDYQFELDWLTFLAEKGMPVTAPIKRKDGRLFGMLHAPEGDRYYTLFNFAEGKPMSLENPDHLFACGAAMARIHKASDDFSLDYEARAPMDLKFLIEKPVARIEQLWDDDRDDDLVDTMLVAAAEAKAEIEELIRNERSTPGSWGPIGGDFHHGSTFIDEKGQLVFFNFDWCGYGWRAYDIATFLLNTNLMHRDEKLSEAFFAGYYSERPLSENEHAAISPFLTIRRVWMTSYFTMQEGVAGYTFIAPAWIRED